MKWAPELLNSTAVTDHMLLVYWLRVVANKHWVPVLSQKVCVSHAHTRTECVCTSTLGVCVCVCVWEREREQERERERWKSERHTTWLDTYTYRNCLFLLVCPLHSVSCSFSKALPLSPMGQSPWATVRLYVTFIAMWFTVSIVNQHWQHTYDFVDLYQRTTTISVSVSVPVFRVFQLPLLTSDMYC